MAINLHEKYAKQIQSKFVQESIIAGLLSNEYSWSGVKTVKISTPLTTPMVDYTRTGTNRYGEPTEMQDTVQAVSYTHLGPQGEPGAQGPQGEQGPMGPQGPVSYTHLPGRNGAAGG